MKYSFTPALAHPSHVLRDLVWHAPCVCAFALSSMGWNTNGLVWNKLKNSGVGFGFHGISKLGGRDFLEMPTLSLKVEPSIEDQKSSHVDTLRAILEVYHDTAARFVVKRGDSFLVTFIFIVYMYENWFSHFIFFNLFLFEITTRPFKVDEH